MRHTLLAVCTGIVFFCLSVFYAQSAKVIKNASTPEDLYQIQSNTTPEEPETKKKKVRFSQTVAYCVDKNNMHNLTKSVQDQFHYLGGVLRCIESHHQNLKLAIKYDLQKDFETNSKVRSDLLSIYEERRAALIDLLEKEIDEEWQPYERLWHEKGAAVYVKRMGGFTMTDHETFPEAFRPLLNMAPGKSSVTRSLPLGSKFFPSGTQIPTAGFAPQNEQNDFWAKKRRKLSEKKLNLMHAHAEEFSNRLGADTLFDHPIPRYVSRSEMYKVFLAPASSDPQS